MKLFQNMPSEILSLRMKSNFALIKILLKTSQPEKFGVEKTNHKLNDREKSRSFSCILQDDKKQEPSLRDETKININCYYQACFHGK